MVPKLFIILEILVLFQKVHSDAPGGSPPAATPTTGPPPANGPPAAAIIPTDKYPNAKRDESVVDTYKGGVKVPDPYRWLEKTDSPETKKFLEDEMTITKPYLDKSPFRAELTARYNELENHPKYKGPFQKSKYFFSFRNTGLQNQDVFYKSDSMKDEGKPFIDVNTLSKDGSVTMGNYGFTDDGKLIAYSLGSSGSDWKTVHFKDVEKDTDLPDKLEKVTYTELGWSNDGKGIFYAGYRDENVKTDGSSDENLKNEKLYYHLLGTEQSKDLVIAEFPDNPDYTLDPYVSDCGKYLIVVAYDGFENNLVYVTDISKSIAAKPQLKQIVTKMDSNYSFVANNGNQFIFRTNKGADNHRLIIIDITNPDPGAWKDLVAEDKKNNLDWAYAVHDKYLVLSYIVDVKSVLQLHDMGTGKMIKKFQLDIGTVDEELFFGDRKTPHIFFNFESFLTPCITYHCDLSKPSFDLEIINETEVKNFDREKFTVEQIFYPSKDGTKIPMHCVYKKGFKKDGNNFAFMYVFGAFGESTLPYFATNRLVVIQNFYGIHCVPNVRGGGEYGKTWHQDGSLDKKQHTFDDFQAAAEYLINEKYTNRKLLAVNGGGSGGLVLGACFNQRPDLFGTVVAQAGLFDMLRYEKLSSNHNYVVEYGSSSDPKFFPILYGYSPLHNVKIPQCGDKQYPAIMLTTSDQDNKIPSPHSLKFIATLQYEAKKHPNQKNPFVLNVETGPGHGIDKSLTNQIAQTLDMMSFIVINTGIQFHPCQ